MATCPYPRPMSFQRHRLPPPIHNCTNTATNLTAFFSSTSELNLNRSFPPKRSPRSGRCHASGPQPEPPSEEHLSPLSGVATTFTRFQVNLQIFFAVLFWMSLFFWSSTWNRGNDGRPKKGPRFRK